MSRIGALAMERIGRQVHGAKQTLSMRETTRRPTRDVGRIEIPQRSSLLPGHDVLSFFGQITRSGRRRRWSLVPT
jgi:hypothetical protein